MVFRTRMSPDRVRRVTDALASGLNGMQAAEVTGVSKSAIYRWLASIGGVIRPAGTTYCHRYLDREDRYEIARLHEQGLSNAEIGRRLGRHRGTIGEELKRNVDPRTGRYQPERADRLAYERQRRPKPSKLSRNEPLRELAQKLLDRDYSPEQVSGRVRLLYPDNPEMQISPETIYQSLYVYPRGELSKELQAHLRTERAQRKRRGRRETRGKIRDMVGIAERPEEVEGRLVPGHHEGDLIKGSTASNSAVGTIVERTTGFLTLLPLHDGHTAIKVADAVVEHLTRYPDWFTKTLTWDRGVEMAQHASITDRTGIKVYFADPYCPWQRGSNENINGLLREYLKKSSDLSIHTVEELDAIANQLNDRPRKRLGFYTPREAFTSLLTGKPRVATTP
jgi:transposase, IS30 family